MADAPVLIWLPHPTSGQAHTYAAKVVFATASRPAKNPFAMSAIVAKPRLPLPPVSPFPARDLMSVLYSRTCVRQAAQKEGTAMAQMSTVVGTLHCPHRTVWPETSDYFYDGAHILRIFYPDPTQAEIDAVTRSPIALAVAATPKIGLFLFKLTTDEQWTDIGFHTATIADTDERAPAGDDDLLYVVLVDGNGGIVKARRTVRMPYPVAERLNTILRTQVAQEAGFDRADTEHHLDTLRSTISTAALLASAISGIAT